MAEVLERVVLPAAREAAATWAKAATAFTPHPETRLLGSGASLDSLGAVTFVVEVEERLAEEYGRDLTLASEHAMSRRHSPFATLGTLAEYISELLAEPSVP